MSTGPSTGKLALLVGGGPAPGINGVISAVTIEASNTRHPGVRRPRRLQMARAGATAHFVPADIDDVKDQALRGGSMLGTSPAPIRPSRNRHEQRPRSALRDLNIDALVTIGGDDTAYSASQVYKRAGGKIRVAHVPKTIDNDLPLPGSTPTFGFETARRPGREDRPQPGRGCPHHLALVSGRQHGPGRRAPGPGHRQGGRRHA